MAGENMNIRCISFFSAFIAAAGLVGSASAVIVGSGDGTQDTSQPPGIPGWNNVGQVNAGSGTYIGNGWVLTAFHVNPGNITFDATSGSPGTYLYDGQSMRLTNPSDGSPTDLLLFHLATTPTLPNLNIPASSPALGTFVYTMGYGLSRDPNVTYYNVTGTGMSTVFTETTPAMANYAGFKEITPNIKRWGTNLTRDNHDNGQALQTFDTGDGNLTAFQTDFYSQGTSEMNGTAEESQLAAGDSGAGVFDTSNNLIGLNDSVDPFPNQPPNTAVFGNYSDYADLATYRSQIPSITQTPEPSAIALVAISLPLALRRRRRRV